MTNGSGDRSSKPISKAAFFSTNVPFKPLGKGDRYNLPLNFYLLVRASKGQEREKKTERKRKKPSLAS